MPRPRYFRPGFLPPSALALLAFVSAAAAQSYTLDDPASPVAITFDGSTARISAHLKATGATWQNPDSGGGHTVTLSGVTQSDPTHLVATGTTSNGYPISLALSLAPDTGDLTVTIAADPALNISGSIRYPYAFFPPDGSGFMVMPVFGGYVVPTVQTSWSPPSSHSRLEWFGGVDDALSGGWMMIAEPAPAADMELVAETGTIQSAGNLQRRGGVFKWIGSNANAARLANRFSYDRTARIRFFASGGYVAQAKSFREYARRQGWLVTLADKAARNPDVDRIIGAPIIYLWGDGRSTAMLDALTSAGISRALLQLSINHVDHNNAFPNQEFAGGAGWSNLVRAHGFVPGIYDIYSRYSAVQSQPPFNGFFYLWPSNANPEWIYRNADGGLDPQPTVNASLAASFARSTRLPAHDAAFGLDAYFTDVLCAVMPREDYDDLYGHFQTRAQDIAARQSLLRAVSLDLNKLAGVEQIKSWAIPSIHWGEGVFWLGGSPAVGAWNNNTYPEIMTDVKDPGSAAAAVLTTAYRAPLFELVYHDCAIATVHWRRAHNKLLYAWTLNDQFAMLRGQAPLLNLVYNAEPGAIGRAISGATDARDGSFWDTRFTNPLVRDRVIQTFNTVCDWHRTVGLLEMTDSRALSPDFTVQMAEFSNDGGTSGHGIVVNFGGYDGAYGMSGPAWTGQLRGHALTVPVGGFATYQFDACSSSTCTADVNCSASVTIQDIFDFLAAYFASSPDADFNASGSVSVQDIFDFLAAYFAGC